MTLVGVALHLLDSTSRLVLTAHLFPDFDSGVDISCRL